MIRPIKSGLALACALALAFPAAADEFADSGTHVLPPSPPNDDCLVAGGDCDTTGDTTTNATNVEDAFGGLFQPSNDISPDATVSLGYDQNTGVGGVLTLNFDDNLCFDNPGLPDIAVAELVVEDEDFVVRAGLAGQLAAVNKSLLETIGDVRFYGIELDGVTNQIELTATASNDNNLAGPDIDAAGCIWDLDQADIVKDFATTDNETADDTGFDDDIFVGIDAQQHKAFTIRIENTTGIDGAFAGLTFMDVVPAEFDVDSVAVDNASEADDDGECSASANEHTNSGKSGKEQLQPDFITIDASGLEDGQACTITVEVVTDLKKGGTRPGRGNSPEYTPTSCPDGGVVLNDGVRIIDDATGATIFSDDDTLALACEADPV